MGHGQHPLEASDSRAQVSAPCKEEEGEASVSPPAMTLSMVTDSTNKVPVVKAKATHVIMNSLITKQTQESMQRFEQQAGWRDAGYTPHKGLTIEETKYLRAYKGTQKPSHMELIHAQATRMAEDPATFKPPKMDVPVIEGKKPLPRTHNLKPRDLNGLTPTGF
ncbi:Hypothetical predicted protein [Marmota monax]|uniref:Putative monooxygenase p33MONOX n=1 Tax=Marmota monax TaxID=9995 RepID=A0A5E4AGV9_MARMO|nr:hypothetical protein GHT09_008932 [Marmota monax]VTJ56478.1 Hypothetical predicted protein [Marmota monax]